MRCVLTWTGIDEKRESEKDIVSNIFDFFYFLFFLHSPSQPAAIPRPLLLALCVYNTCLSDILLFFRCSPASPLPSFQVFMSFFIQRWFSHFFPHILSLNKLMEPFKIQFDIGG